MLPPLDLSATTSMPDIPMEPPAKRRRLSCDDAIARPFIVQGAGSRHRRDASINRAAKQFAKSPETTASAIASQTISPFLSKHLPSSMHAPFGQSEKQTAPMAPTEQDDGGKYCYRHRLDLKCRRQADEPSMDQLQKDIESLPQDDQQGIAHVWALFSAAPAKQRNLMLQGILTQCCFPQLSYLATKTRELIKIDFMTALPAELAIKVLCYLDTTSLTKAAQVSKNWRRLADDDVVWHKMCEQHIDRKCSRCGWGLPLLERRRLLESKKQIERRVANIANELTLQARKQESPYPPAESLTQHEDAEPAQTRPWKDVYRDRFRVGCNWKHGRFSTQIFRGHTDGVMALQFDDNVLVTGSYDSTIKIWDIQTGSIMRTLTGHTSGIRCLHLDDKFLISGSLDQTIRVWDWRAGTLSRTINIHTGGVLSLHFVGKIFASGSQDNTIRITNFKSKDSYALTGHTDWVNCVRIDAASRTLFSASDDNTVRLWDLDTRKTIRIFQGHVGQVQQVMPLPKEYDFDEEPCEDDHSSDGYKSSTTTPVPDDDYGPSPESISFSEHSHARPPPPHYMLTGSLDGTARLWDVRSGRIIRTFFGHVEGVWALACDTLRIVTGAQDRSVKVWDPKTGRCDRTITGHAGPVTCIGLGDSSMFTGSEDGEVRGYSFET